LLKLSLPDAKQANKKQAAQTFKRVSATNVVIVVISKVSKGRREMINVVSGVQLVCGERGLGQGYDNWLARAGRPVHNRAATQAFLGLKGRS